jgi:hypothetical protein
MLKPFFAITKKFCTTQLYSKGLTTYLKSHSSLYHSKSEG